MTIFNPCVVAEVLLSLRFVQVDGLLRMMSPLFAHARIVLQRHCESPEEQRSPIHHAQLVRKVQYPILPVQLAMPFVIEVLRLEGAEHEPAEFREEPSRVGFGFDAQVAEVVGHDFVRLAVGDAEYEFRNPNPLVLVETLHLTVVDYIMRPVRDYGQRQVSLRTLLRVSVPPRWVAIYGQHGIAEYTHSNRSSAVSMDPSRPGR